MVYSENLTEDREISLKREGEEDRARERERERESYGLHEKVNTQQFKLIILKNIKLIISKNITI